MNHRALVECRIILESWCRIICVEGPVSESLAKQGTEDSCIIGYFMLGNALCIGYLPEFLEHWLVVLAALVVLFVFITMPELGEGNHLC